MSPSDESDLCSFRGELPIVKVAGSTRYDVEDLNGYIAVNRCRIASVEPEKRDIT